MRVPVEWLADYVAIELPVEELAHGLTMAGLKVEAIESIGLEWRDVGVGQVVAIEPHPTSKKPLWVTQVDLGAGRIETIVTGAQNVSLGQKVPVVPVGGILPRGPDGGPLAIQPRPMAGITSHGMLASARELGIGDEHEGILTLPPDSPVGANLRGVLGGDVLEIETNPNRPDTLSIIGIAREVAAITQQQLSLPDLEAVTGDISWVPSPSIDVEISDPDLCPRYTALRISGVTATESPAWLQQRLQQAGLRPINLLVDITNYVMLEYGQPLHAFDATDLAGNRIVVRRARDGEALRTLDGQERVLVPDNLVIADAERAVAVAGVMGGENSEIHPDTREVVLESANFDPVSVRLTAKSLGVRTESSSRFEKGLPPEQTVLAARRYLQLLAQIVDGPLRAWEMSDVGSSPPAEPIVTMPMRDLHRLVGIPITSERAAEALSLLGFDVAEADGAVSAHVPFWRRTDIQESADLVEEVARIVGYDEIPVTLPRRTMRPPPLPADLACEAVLRDRLLGNGLSEAVTHSLTSTDLMARLFAPGTNGHDHEAADLWAEIVPNAAGVYEREALTLPVRLANPATVDRQVMRLTLMPSLLDVVARNRRHTEERLAFFEIARTPFSRTHDLPYERRTLAIALAGRREARSWIDTAPGPHTFFDLKGILVELLGALQIERYHVEPLRHPALHPGRAASVQLAGHDVAYLGELHPGVAERFELAGERVQIAELDLDSLIAAASDTHVFHPIPRYPAALRDIALLLDRDLPAERVMEVIRQAGDGLLETAQLFDVYAGPPLPDDRKSVAVSLTFRSPGATLTQAEVNAAFGRIVAALVEQLHAQLRA